ncbi:hypothetical protein CHUAL_011533 [Chamberlinius hualienensis]
MFNVVDASNGHFEMVGNLDQLTEEEQRRVKAHHELHERHKGHEGMHTQMFFILIITMLVAQIILVEWKKRWFQSYQIATLIAMWIIPFAFCIYHSWWRFIFIWLIFSSITIYILSKTRRQPIEGTTPRLVYRWFLLIYKMSYCIGLFGYIVMMLTLLGFNLLLDVKPTTGMDLGLLCLFYALYYGVMGRDYAEICTDTMAVKIGYYKPDGMPIRNLDPNKCAVCGNSLETGESGNVEATCKLSCSHTFHEFCIRGWCILGKKQTCPFCKEKVDLKRMFPNPYPCI